MLQATGYPAEIADFYSAISAGLFGLLRSCASLCIVISWWFHRLLWFHRGFIVRRKDINMMRLGPKCSFVLTLHCDHMSFKQGRNCPICYKENLYYLGDHLRQVHKISGAEKKRWLKSAVFSSTQSTGVPYMPPYPFWGMPHYPMNMKPQ